MISKDKRIYIIIVICTLLLVICEILSINNSISLKSLMIILTIILPSVSFEMYYSLKKEYKNISVKNLEYSNKIKEYSKTLLDKVSKINANTNYLKFIIEDLTSKSNEANKLKLDDLKCIQDIKNINKDNYELMNELINEINNL